MVRSFVIGALLLLAAACGRLAEYGDPRLRPVRSGPGEATARDGAEAGVVSSKGTVRRLEQDGGFWGVRSDDGRRYRIVDLPPIYQKEGTRIRFAGRLRPGGAAAPWGTLLELTEVSGV